MSRPPGDRGSGTVWTVAWCAVIWLLVLAVLAVAAARVDRFRAAGAADLAALAAAAHTHEGEAAACRRAAATAAANGAALAHCAVSGAVAEVRVRRPLRHWPASVTARARAGPPPEPTSAGP